MTSGELPGGELSTISKLVDLDLDHLDVFVLPIFFCFFLKHVVPCTQSPTGVIIDNLTGENCVPSCRTKYIWTGCHSSQEHPDWNGLPQELAVAAILDCWLASYLKTARPYPPRYQTDPPPPPPTYIILSPLPLIHISMQPYKCNLLQQITPHNVIIFNMFKLDI